MDFAAFKKCYKRWSERALAGRGVLAIGVLEREVAGDFTGDIHCHILFGLPQQYQADDAREALAAEMRQIWRECHAAFLAGPPPGSAMTMTRFHDGSGALFLRYVSKCYNRGPAVAKWGIPPRHSPIVSANLPKLWERDELPERWRAHQGDPIAWFRAHLTAHEVREAA